jgi:Mitochondrial carrier protein
VSPGGNALPALGHAVAGSTGSAISNVCTYPLDLIVTRLQIQREFRKDRSQAHGGEYESIQDAAQRIYETEGGVSGFYTGLAQDTGKTIADSFLFFLAYSFLRKRRITARSAGGSKAAVALPVLDELGIGFIAGSFTKLFTAPVSNIVTRKQTSALTCSRPSDPSSISSSESRFNPRKAPSTAQIARDILQEKGILGFWSGYSAALILTLNPSLTFLLFETFKRFLLPLSKRENPPPSATFLIAAISKACASSVTYPFSVAKARAQVSTKLASSSDASMTSTSSDSRGEKHSASSSTSTSKSAVKTTVFSTILGIVQSDGPGALYSGLSLELVKSFLSHGTTMIVKQYVHRFIIQAYYVLSLVAARLRSKELRKGAHAERLLERARDQRFEYYDLARHRAGERFRDAKEKADGIRSAVADLGGQLVGKANETADLVADYVEEETEEWRSLYGTGLAKWSHEK